jgi:hypothetical protein
MLCPSVFSVPSVVDNEVSTQVFFRVIPPISRSNNEVSSQARFARFVRSVVSKKVSTSVHSTFPIQNSPFKRSAPSNQSRALKQSGLIRVTSHEVTIELISRQGVPLAQNTLPEGGTCLWVQNPLLFKPGKRIGI